MVRAERQEGKAEEEARSPWMPGTSSSLGDGMGGLSNEDSQYRDLLPDSSLQLLTL